MDADPIEGQHLWREFRGAVDQFSAGRFARTQAAALQLDAVALFCRRHSATASLVISILGYAFQ
jgi:hypothetical protein